MMNLLGQQLLSGLRLLGLSDVSSDFGCADYLASPVLHRRHGNRNVDERSVLAATYGLIVFDSLALADAPENVGFLVVTIRWDECENWRADHLLRSIAKETLGPLIPAGDNAVEIHADNGVV